MIGSLLQLQTPTTSMWEKTMIELTNIFLQQTPTTSMWEKTMIELTNIFLQHVRFSKQNTHKHMFSFTSQNNISQHQRKKEKTLNFGGL